MDNQTAQKILDEFLEGKERSWEVGDAISHCIRKNTIQERHKDIITEAMEVDLVDIDGYLLDNTML